MMSIQDCKKLKHQAAGHDGPLTDQDEMLLFKPSNNQEIEFYEKLSTRVPSNVDSNDVPFHYWTPAFLGVLREDKSQTAINDREQLNFITEKSKPIALSKLPNINTEKTYLVLENLLYGYVRPNILDIKLGRILWDESASEEKRIRLKEVSRTTTSGSLGFRICGMKMCQNSLINRMLDPKYYASDDDEYILVNKFYGRELTQSNVTDAFDVFFGDDKLSSERRACLIDTFLKRLQLFYNSLLNEEVRMISSSLLFIYECDPSRWDILENDHELLPSHLGYEDEENEDDESDEENRSDKYDTYPQKPKTLSNMALIDFAHSKFTPGSGIDDNTIEGVENLISIFEKLKTKYTV